jgi:hypothetical protein
MDKLVKLICKNEENLMSTLAEQQKETFERFKECQSEICDLTARQAFSDGFILAIRIMVEVMDGMETVEEI